MFQHRGAATPTYTRPVLATCYRLRSRLWAIGDDLWIEAGDGHRPFLVDERALHERGLLVLRNAGWNELYSIPGYYAIALGPAGTVTPEESRSLRADWFAQGTPPPRPQGDRLNILQHGKVFATAVRREPSPTASRMAIELVGGGILDVTGNLAGHDYLITQGDRRLATVSKEWLIPADTYEVAIELEEDHALLLTVAAAVDQMARA